MMNFDILIHILDYKTIVQIFVTLIVGGYILNKILWETYKTHQKLSKRQDLFELNW